MGRCPQCGFGIEAGAAKCPQCNVALLPSGELAHDDSSKTVELSQREISGTIESAEEVSDESDVADTPDVDAGTGTVSAPGVEGGYGDDPEDSPELVDGIVAELDEDEEFDSYEDNASTLVVDPFGTQSPFGGESGTIDVAKDSHAGKGGAEADTVDFPSRTIGNAGSESEPDESDPGTGTVASGGSSEAAAQNDSLDAESKTIDFSMDSPGSDHAVPTDGDGQATISASGEDTTSKTLDLPSVSTDGNRTHVAVDGPAGGSSHSEDDAGTVVLPDDRSKQGAGDRTIVYDSADSRHGTIPAGSSGTEGSLKRLWAAVAGSSENPMHSLHAVGLQASDSVFERVATRRVADAHVKDNVTADYQIIDKLGEGAMGIVFSARQTGVDRVVAIKTAKPNYQKNDESRRRFLYEAHITADLDHSNIVPIHELGASEEGMLFYSMKLVKGTEWSRVIRKKTREQNLEIFMKVADAMAFAHSKGVVHRDLKPENTMLGQFGEVFVTDWGTAVNLDKETTRLAEPASTGDKYLTVIDGSGLRRGDTIVLHDGENRYDRLLIHNVDEDNPNRLYFKKRISRDYRPSPKLKVVKDMNLAGTPCYMAPEMAGHQLEKIGKTSDIYILGAILYDVVRGKAPHTGTSVTQCLRAALANDIVKSGGEEEDALLTIVFRAMATEPSDRYQTVEELQDAVREYRRHAESIALSDRAEELHEKAVEQVDYETFSRAMFGFRDAIELWPENKAAVVGLKRTRHAFGKAALDKGDYDFVFQTVDREDPEEAKLFDQAVQGKKKAEGRESALRVLKKAIAAVVLVAIVALSGLSIYAFNQSRVATLARDEEKASREKADALADANGKLAENERKLKEDAEKATIRETELKTAATILAKSETKLKEDALIAADREKELKEQATTLANNEKMLKEDAIEAAKRETRLKLAAISAAAKIQLGENNSILALAKSQIDAYDVAGSTQNLAKLQAPVGDVFFGLDPDVDTWGWQRINLLSNSDLPSAKIEGTTTTSDFAAEANLAVVGTREGFVRVLRFDGRQLVEVAQHQQPNASIDAVAISPDGREVVYAYSTKDESGTNRWEVGQDQAQPVASAGKRAFQQIGFSSNGRELIAGINGGIWIWQLADDWYMNDTPTRRNDSIRGALEHLQSIDSHTSLFCARFDNELTVGLLDHASGEASLLILPERLKTGIASAAHLLVSNQIAFGTNSNELFIGTLNAANLSVTNLVQLESKHRAPVTQMVVDGAGQLITASNNEPVAHVWDYVEGQWNYDTFLAGTAKNLAGVGLIGQGQVVAVDQSGDSIVWDVERQKQRRQLRRIVDGKAEDYIAPVFDVFAASSKTAALTIDENGAVDLWSLVDGTTKQLSGNRWSYIGHTPGARFVDSAVDLQRGIVVTAASLRHAERRYLSKPEDEWEFCIWDVQTGEMNKRWTTPNRRISEDRVETIEQRISLVDDGRQVLFASDNETRLVELETGEEVFRRSDFGSYFAVPNPQNSSLVMLVKRSGSVRLLDLRNPDSSWLNESYKNYALADPSDIPQKGVWSEDGSRFYMTFSTGSLAVFRWTGGRLDLTWSSRILNGQPAAEAIVKALKATNGRVQSHLDVDLLVADALPGDIVHIATRSRGNDASTKLTSLRFAADGSPTLVASEEPSRGVQWIKTDAQGQVTLTDRLHDVLTIDGSRVRSHVRVNRQAFVSTPSAQVFGLVDGETKFLSYGRSPLVSSTGSADGNVLYALHEDGALWKFQVETQGGLIEGVWRKLDYAASGAKRIQLSPGGQLLITGEESRLVQPDSGQVAMELGGVAAASWDRNSSDLAIGRDDGSIEIVTNGVSRLLPIQADLAEGRKIVDIQFFVETWRDATKDPRRHLIVHTENATDGYWQFLAVDPAPENAAELIDQKQGGLALVTKGTRFATSPTDGMLVSGAPGGTVTVWSASPTWESKPRQLFDLEGHRGAEITCLKFTGDGKTIVSADTKNRLFGWISADPLLLVDQ